MCSGSRSKVCSTDLSMEAEIQKEVVPDFSVLLELAASDDITNFKKAIEEDGRNANEVGLWYGRRIGVKKMGYEERTPLMIAAAFGSKKVLSYMVEKGVVDVNQTCGSDKATAFLCAIAGGSTTVLEVVKILLDASADVDLVDASRARTLQPSQLSLVSKCGSERKEYPVDPSLPDIKTGIYGTDDFRMYLFKVKPCSRAYSHDWTECPFVHPGENARRRDPRKYHYSCVPCPEFRKGVCQRGDACEYSHGIFECWLHPAQYRTRMCKDETNCNRRVCFFAHKPEELRPLYPSTGSAVLSPITPPMSPSAASGGSLWPGQSIRHGGMKPANLDDIFGTIESPRMHSPTYASGHSSPSFRSYGIDASSAASSRSAAFAKRSHSFIERTAGNRLSAMPSNLSGWGSPDGKLDWGIQKEELNKLRKSASFGLRASLLESSVEPDVSWVQSPHDQQYYRLNTNRGSETIPTWADLYMEQEQIVA